MNSSWTAATSPPNPVRAMSVYGWSNHPAAATFMPAPRNTRSASSKTSSVSAPPRRSPVVEWEHPKPETVSPYAALKYEFVAGRSSVVWVMTGDRLQDPAAILRAVRQWSDLVHAPGELHRASAADSPRGRPQSRDPAIAGRGHDTPPRLGTQGKRRQPGRHGAG